MGLLSHSAAQHVGRQYPPASRRQCRGIVVTPGFWKRAADGSETFVPRRERPCMNGCSPWVPEMDYCASHMPSRWVEVAAARAELWKALSDDIWAEVLAQFPRPWTAA